MNRPLRTGLPTWHARTGGVAEWCGVQLTARQSPGSSPELCVSLWVPALPLPEFPCLEKAESGGTLVCKAGASTELVNMFTLYIRSVRC